MCIFFPFTNIYNTKYSQTTINIEFTKHVVFIVQQRFICNLCQLLVVVFKFERILLGFINIITLISIFIFHIALINHYNNCDYKYICNYDFVCWCLTVESYMVAERVCINNIKHYGWYMLQYYIMLVLYYYYSIWVLFVYYFCVLFRQGMRRDGHRIQASFLFVFFSSTFQNNVSF